MTTHESVLAPVRTFVALAFADDVFATPSLLEAYVRRFGPEDDATLIVYASALDEAQLGDQLGELVAHLGVAEDALPDVLGVADVSGRLEAVVARNAHALLVNAPPPATFNGIERFTADEIDALLSRALREWSAPDAWLWRPEPERVEVAVEYPAGHFYSPSPDTLEIAREPRSSQVWPAIPRLPAGVRFREDAQLSLCRDVFARQERLVLADESEDPTEYTTSNGQYPALDAWVLEAFLRHLRPRRLIEIGCGHSTQLTARVNRELLGSSMQVTCVEPYPPPFLELLPGIELRVEQVQDTPPAVFQSLTDGDVLFIDSSHVVKSGSDATFEYLEILPSLAPGVVVHVHDIFFPRDYPRPWVSKGYGWNEQYVLQAFLAYNDAFEVLFSTYLMLLRHPEALAQAFPGVAERRYAQRAAGSFWMRRLPA